MKNLIILFTVLMFFSCGEADVQAKLDPNIPTAEMRDKDLEKELVAYFNNMGWQEKFFAAVIVSDEWNYKKSHTGIITGRTLAVLMVSQKPDGKCMHQSFTIIQQKTPDGFGKSKRYGTGSQTSCACDGAPVG